MGKSKKGNSKIKRKIQKELDKQLRRKEHLKWLRDNEGICPL